ncbi:hypothetical protein BH20ACT15_BH20ACT15_05200 [soil metagenome]
MNPVSRAWKTASEGTGRTVRWALGGLRDGTVSGAAKLAGTDGARAESPEQPAASKPAASKPEGGRNQRTIGLAIGVGVIVAMWIGWTIYIWAENGSAAGIGVLISWPAVFAALALISAPFVGGALAMRRHRGGSAVAAGSEHPAEPPSWAPKGALKRPGGGEVGSDPESAGD